MVEGLILYRYQTSVDRAGASIVVGGFCCALLAVGLMTMAGLPDPVAMVIALLVAWLLSAMAITAVAGPLWLVLHLTGRRGPLHAALTGGATGFVVFLAAQTHALGLAVDAPVTDAATTLFRWASAAATSLILALAAALIGVVMWRVAYYRAR
ncbi:MAG: hypothetical protein ACRCSO_13280 [Sphingomonas sp.]